MARALAGSGDARRPANAARTFASACAALACAAAAESSAVIIDKLLTGGAAMAAACAVARLLVWMARALRRAARAAVAA